MSNINLLLKLTQLFSICRIMKIVILWQKTLMILLLRLFSQVTSEYQNTAKCSLNFVFKEDDLSEVKVLDVSKTIQESDIPVKFIMAKDNFFAEAICFHFNKSLENGRFPNCLKLSNITPSFKKGARTSKNNHRLVSILSVF